MNITVHSRNGRVPATLERFATEKMAHLVKFLPTIASIDIELYEEGRATGSSGHVAHVTVSTAGPSFRSKVTSGDPRTCIDIASDRLSRRITEFKRKRSSKPAHARARRPAHKERASELEPVFELPQDRETQA